MSDIKFACPQCQQHIQCEPGYGGMEIGCPTCSARIIVPRIALAPAMAPAPAVALPPRISSAAPPPVSTAPPPPRPGTAPRPLPPAGSVTATKKSRGKDGWATEESGFNKLGLYIVMIASIGAAFFCSGFLGVEVGLLIPGIIVAVAGLVGGWINIMGRGPAWAGMLVGIVFALGSFGAAAFWMAGKHSVRKYELVIACVIGGVPAMGLQWALQKMLMKSQA